jgi:hypothetical protein
MRRFNAVFPGCLQLKPRGEWNFAAHRPGENRNSTNADGAIYLNSNEKSSIKFKNIYCAAMRFE